MTIENVTAPGPSLRLAVSPVIGEGRPAAPMPVPPPLAARRNRAVNHEEARDFSPRGVFAVHRQADPEEIVPLPRPPEAIAAPARAPPPRTFPPQGVEPHLHRCLPPAGGKRSGEQRAPSPRARRTPPPRVATPGAAGRRVRRGHVPAHLPPPERYAMMTMEFEAGSFPTKAAVMDRVRELNDFEADTLLAFDRNDEQNHVRYGHRWLPEMMALFGETRPVAEFVKATQEKFRELTKAHGNKTPHSLPKEKRLTGEKILRLAGVSA